MPTLIPRKKLLKSLLVGGLERDRSWARAVSHCVLSPKGDVCAYFDIDRQTITIFSIGKEPRVFTQYSIAHLLQDYPIVDDLEWGCNNLLFISVAKMKGAQIGYLGSSPRLWFLNTITGVIDCLAPENARCTALVRVSSQMPDQVLLKVQYDADEKRQPESADQVVATTLQHETHLVMYDFISKKFSVIDKKSGFLSYVYCDDQLKPRFCAIITRQEEEAKKIELFGKDARDDWQSIFSATSTREQPVCIEGFSSDYSKMYYLDGRPKNAKFVRAYAFNIDEGTSELLHSFADSDVRGVLLADGDSGDIIGYGSEVARPKIHWVTGKFQAMAPLFDRIRLDIPFRFSLNNDDSLFLLSAEDDPDTVNIYDVATGGVIDSFAVRTVDSYTPKINYARMEPRTFRSRDGLNLHCYITLPRGAGRGPVPFVMRVHGGPWARDKQRYRADVQFFADRGLGSVLVNFRGSTGFGKDFCQAGDGKWGREMIDDLEDVVLTLRQEGIMDHRVIVAGFSYGGNAVYSALAFKPDLFLAGVAGAGDCDLVQSIRSEKKPEGKKHWIKLMGGDPDLAEGAESLIARSPYFHAEQITKPVLIISPADDTIVFYEQTRIMAERLEQLGKIVTEIKVENEGHNIHKPENILAIAATTEAFCQQWIGSRAEPFGVTLREAPDFKVIRGAQYIPALQAQRAFDAQLKNEEFTPTPSLSLALVPQPDQQIMGAVLTALNRTHFGQVLLEKLFDAAIAARLITRVTWQQNADGITVSLNQVDLQKAVRKEDVINFSTNFLLSKPEYCAVMLSACQGLLRGTATEETQGALELSARQPDIRVQGVSMLMQFHHHKQRATTIKSSGSGERLLLK